MSIPQIPQNDSEDSKETCGVVTAEIPDVLTVEEVATWLRINRKTVYEAAKSGQIPCCKVGRILRFSRQAVLQWLNGQGRVSTKRSRP